MGAGPLVTEISITFFLVAYLLHKYGNWSNHHILVTVNVFIAWYFAFIIIFILPMDVSSTVYRQCLRELNPSEITLAVNLSQSPNDSGIIVQNSTSIEDDDCKPPWSIVPEGTLPSLWRVVYWTAQALTWIVLPIMQSYSTSGYFTVAGKLKAAVLENVAYYGSYLLLFGFFFVYLAIRSGIVLYGPNLKVVCVTASNTWGLFLLVLLLGYGLVEVPRGCWNTTRKGYTLNYLYFKASKLSSEKCEAEEKVDDLLEELTQIASSIPVGHPVRQNVDLIIAKFPGSRSASQTRRSSEAARYSSETVGLKTLAKLHKQAIRAIQMYNRTHCQWNMLCERAFYWEDVVRNEKNRERVFKHTFIPQRSTVARILYSPKLEWYWQFVFRNWVYRTICIILTVFGAVVVWSEMTFCKQYPTLSLFAIFIKSAKNNYIFIEIISITTIAYLCFCAYYTVFRVRVLNYYYLAPHHQTNEYSLIFCGMMLCRLTPPLCLNFLGLIHLDSHITKDGHIEETAYTRIMGHLDLISIISDYFNIYFPILIVFVCLATYFNLGSRFLHLVGFEQFVENDEMTTDLIDEGRELIKREKNKRLRFEDMESRRRPFQERFTPGGEGSGSFRHNARSASSLSTPEENAHSELLKNVEPIAYTDGDNSNVLMVQDKDFNTFGAPSDAYSARDQSSYHNSWNRIGRPSVGLFDDV